MRFVASSRAVRVLLAPVGTMLALSLLATPALQAQNIGWEGETGVFVTPLAYTAPSEGRGFGRPEVAYHYFNAGSVVGDFHEFSITEGVAQRFEFGFTRQLHTA